jgi:hypothetical protein
MARVVVPVKSLGDAKPPSAHLAPKEDFSMRFIRSIFRRPTTTTYGLVYFDGTKYVTV